jgi:hypothetical protein
MNDKGVNQATPPHDGNEIALDAVLTAASIGMLAAIRQGLELDSGLAQIIGAPPRLEMPIPELPAENGESPADSWRF